MSDQPSSPDASPRPPWFHFGEIRFPCARQVTAGHLSQTPNNQINTILFDDLLADSQGPDSGLSTTTTVALEVPAEVLSNDPFLGYFAELRGVCIKSAGSRAVLTAQLGGITCTQTFPYDETHDGSWFAEVFSFERRPNKDSGQPVVPLPPFTINVLISVQRRKKDDFVQLSLDSIDLSADRI